MWVAVSHNKKFLEFQVQLLLWEDFSCAWRGDEHRHQQEVLWQDVTALQWVSSFGLQRCSKNIKEWRCFYLRSISSDFPIGRVSGACLLNRSWSASQAF